MNIEEWAEAAAARHLEYLPRRWTHTQGVADKAREVSVVLPPPERSVLVAAAYLHDVGYGSALAKVGFHPLDGARWLETLGYPRLARLVAHHSGARYEAALRGLYGELLSYEEERSELADALAYCDLTTDPDGRSVTFPARLAEIVGRYGPGHLVTQAITDAAGELAGAVGRTLALLSCAPAAGR